jgi:hypothetical protein
MKLIILGDESQDEASETDDDGASEAEEDDDDDDGDDGNGGDLRRGGRNGARGRRQDRQRMNDERRRTNEVVVRRAREEDDYIGRRLPSYIAREKRLKSNFDTDNGCPLCFHGTPFYRAGIEVSYGRPLPIEAKNTLDKKADDAIQYDGTLQDVTCVALASEFNEIFNGLNARITASSSVLKYERITPLQIYEHYLTHRKTMSNMLMRDIYELDGMTSDIFRSESLTMQHLSKKTSRGNYEIQFKPKTAQVLKSMLLLKQKLITQQQYLQIRTSALAGSSAGPETQFLH